MSPDPRFSFYRVSLNGFLDRQAFPGVVACAARTRLPVALYVRNDNTRSRLVKLVAVYGPLDVDAPPAITLMMPDED